MNRGSHKGEAATSPASALHIASVCARLRTHASRSMHEKGYKTTDAMQRRDFAGLLRALAKKIEDRRKLRLSVQWWLERAELQLNVYDRENP